MSERTMKHDLLTEPHSCTFALQDEVASFLELSRRAALAGEILLGFIDKSAAGGSHLNPENKAEPNLSRSCVDAFITSANTDVI